MCGRSQLTASPEEIAKHFQLSRPPKYQPNYDEVRETFMTLYIVDRQLSAVGDGVTGAVDVVNVELTGLSLHHTVALTFHCDYMPPFEGATSPGTVGFYPCRLIYQVFSRPPTAPAPISCGPQPWQYLVFSPKLH